MSYVSLARKYRPRRFIDMVGQEATTLALSNAIRLRREPHSVIFTGVRGVGKTTSARIYAKALNCEQGPTAEPCDVCASCLAISAGNHEDVLEIDGASNTGVDDVRALQETLVYVPQRSTFKVYIIDEVHMLSISAFNALLKTLEEPPQHVVFIFATTELNKVPETIQSRCQTFHLQKISRPVIAERVRMILNTEGIAFDEAALALVAREGRGSLRDALTMLDQAIAVGDGQVRMETLRHMVGGHQSLPVLELLRALVEKDAAQVLQIISRWDQEGLSMSQLAEETAKACRNGFILRDLKGQAIDLQLLELEDREQQLLLEMAEKAAPMDFNRLFRTLTKCLDDLRRADMDRFVFENYCLEWCFDPGLPDLQSLMLGLSGGAPVHVAPAGASAIRAPVQTSAADVSAVNLRDRLKSNVADSAAKPQMSAAPLRPESMPAASQKPLIKPDDVPVPAARTQPPGLPAIDREPTVLPHVVPEPARVDLPHARPGAQQADKIRESLAKSQPEPQAPASPPVPPAASSKLVSQSTQSQTDMTQAVKRAEPEKSAIPVTGVTWPATWREFVDEWKKQKPLQGRILEEAYVLEYSPQRIRLAVLPQSMAGGKLLQSEVRKRLLEQFVLLFNFQGQLEVSAKSEDAASRPASTSPEPKSSPHGETLLEVKQRERELARENLKHKLEEHPMTREVISRFGGTIEQIDLQ